jgi:hypothetical protein
MLLMLEFRWINIPSISNLLSYLSLNLREFLPVAIENAQRGSGSGTSDGFRFVVSKSHCFVIRGRPGRWIFMFVWLRIDPTVRLRVVCMPQIALLKISFPFRDSSHTSLALLGAVGHSLLVHHFPTASSLILDLPGYYACYFSPGALVPLRPGRHAFLSILPISRHLYPIAEPPLAEYIPFSYVCFQVPTPNLSNH